DNINTISRHADNEQYVNYSKALRGLGVCQNSSP
ncbi:unnamed protein product, partial [marine sediment metagenome]